MKSIFTTYLLLILVGSLFVGCNPKDFAVTAPTALTNNVNGSMVNFDHNQFLTASCIQCHSNTVRPAIPSHADPKKDCLMCHSASLNPQGIRTWLNVTAFNHTPAPATCANCHGSTGFVNAIPASAPHLTGQIGLSKDCVSCHTNPVWKTAHFDHMQPLSTCTECHESKPIVDPLAVMQKRPVDHPTANYNKLECALCHNNTNNAPDWKSTTIFEFNTHLPAPTTCMGCHESIRPTLAVHSQRVNMPGMDAGDCYGCHNFVNDKTITPAQNWKNGATGYNHDLVKPTSCTLCHKAEPTIPQTIPHATGTYVGKYSPIDCAKCHTYVSTPTSPKAFSKIIFQYSTHIMTDPVTGATQGANACVYCHKTAVNVLPTSNSHALLSRSNTACMNCHQFDMVKQWKNLTNFNHTYLMPGETCSSCHNGTNSLTTKGAAHIATSTDCLTCHNTTAWIPATMVHAATDTNCSSCHNGTQALGKNVTHIPTTDQCSTCHLQSAVAFKPSTFKHGTNTTSCSTCHSGSYTIGGTRVLGKSATHLSTTAECSTCHSTTAWKPATFVHATTDTNCSSCHNGTLALGKSATTHIPTTAQCSTCHTQGGAFKPATFLHKTGDGYTSCSTCHTGAFTTALNAIRGKPATHVATSAECSTCHTNAAWLPAIYTHAATDTNCSSCHNGTSAMGMNAVTHIPTTAQCSTCHTQGGAFKPSTFTHAAIVTTACNTCHTGAFTTAAGLILGQPAGHISTTAQCSSCHTSQTTWLGATGGAPAFLNLPAPITGRAALTTVAHPDTTSTACTVCHTSGVYKPAFGFDHKGMTKSTAGCIWCHATGQAAITKTGMATGVSFTVKTTGHQGANFSTKDCSSSGCHSGLSVTFPTQNATTKVWSGGKWK